MKYLHLPTVNPKQGLHHGTLVFPSQDIVAFFCHCRCLLNDPGLSFYLLSTKYIVAVWYVSENNSPLGPPVYPGSEYPSCLALCILHLPAFHFFFLAVDTGPVGLNRARRGNIMGAADGPGQYRE